MASYAVDANALISLMEPKAPTLEAALDYAVACALVSYSRQVALGHFRLHDMLSVGPFVFALDEVEEVEDQTHCNWRRLGLDDFVVEVCLADDGYHCLRLPHDPNLYEVRAGRLACFEPA